jgi:hypothetical protein
MTAEQFNLELWAAGTFHEYAEGLIRRAEGYELLADAPGQEPNEIREHRAKARELRAAANWMPEMGGE